MPMERSASQRNVHAARKAASRGERTSDSFVAGKAKRKGYVRTSKRQSCSLIPPGKGSNRSSKSKYSRCPPCTVYDERRFIGAKTGNEQGRSGFIASTTTRGAAVARSAWDERTNSKDIEEKGTTKTCTGRRNETISPAKTHWQRVHAFNENEQRILTALTLELSDDISREIETIYDRPLVWNILRVPPLRYYDTINFFPIYS